MATVTTETAIALVQKLRRCRPHERRNVALELASTQSDVAVRELIRMLEGRRRRLFSFYSVDDQLIAVEALGNTGSQAALEYLQNVYSSSTCSRVLETVVTGGGSEPRDDHVYTISFNVYEYRRAKAGLADNLRYKQATSVSEEYYGVLEPDEWPHWASVERPEHKKAHQVFRQAIDKLKEHVNRSGA